jgi:hypothetical protein
MEGEGCMGTESASGAWGDFYQKKLSHLKDADFFQWAAGIVGKPKEKLESFTMHAPLEIMARFLLLSHVQKKYHGLARLQMFASVVRYREIGGELKLPVKMPPNEILKAEPTLAKVREAIDAGDVERALTFSQALCNLESHTQLLCGLADKFVSHYSCGAHSHIYLHLFSQLPQMQQRAALPMSLGFIHELARHPDQQVIPAVTNARNGSAGHVHARALEDIVWDTPKLNAPSEEGISAMLAKSIKHGLDSDIRLNLAAQGKAPNPSDIGFVLPCRIAAFSMIQEDDVHTRYGWTHALTLPQAVLGLSRYLNDPATGMMISNLYAVSYQAILAKASAKTDVNLPDSEQPFDEAIFHSSHMAMSAGWHLPLGQRVRAFERLATEACIRPDCHCVKYVLAAWQMAECDSRFGHVYLAAASRLVHNWISKYPYSQIISRLYERD